MDFINKRFLMVLVLVCIFVVVGRVTAGKQFISVVAIYDRGTSFEASSRTVSAKMPFAMSDGRVDALSSRAAERLSRAAALLVLASVVAQAAGAVNARIGSPVTLTCDSSRHTELFMFWETPLGVVAPGYNTSRAKYKYDVLTGDMKIFIHKPEESGKYSCYSRNLESGMVSVSTVDLLVDDSHLTAGSGLVVFLYRSIAMLSVAIVVLLAVVAHMVWKKVLQKTYIVDDIDQLESIDGDVELATLHP